MIRRAEPADFEPLAQLWNEGWREAHLADTPPALTALRTYDDFLRRLLEMGDDLRVAGPIGAPTGFCAIKGNEIYQIYVGAAARGNGLAADLIGDGEARIAAAGHQQAKLDVIVPNIRAQKFYEKCGWRRRGVERQDMDTSVGFFPLDVLVYVKDLM